MMNLLLQTPANVDLYESAVTLFLIFDVSYFFFKAYFFIFFVLVVEFKVEILHDASLFYFI